MKILAPAGSFDCAVAAIDAGADAVYLGLNDVKHQRSRCTNFSFQELKKILNLSSKNNVEIMVTFNSSYNQDSFEDVLKKIDFIYSLGVRSLIVSDIGLIILLTKKYSDLKINFSVQGQCLNSDFALLLKEIGVSKVVLDRNASIMDARKIKNKTNLEVEMFAFGYQCYSQDSVCYLGDYFMDEPCNVQCASKVKFYDEKQLFKKKRYFFMKFQSCLKYIPDLIKADVDYIKIEGRQRSPNYVYNTTKVFCEAIESYNKNPANFIIKKRWVDILKRCAYGFELTDSFFVDGDYKRKIISNFSIQNIFLYAQDIFLSFLKTNNLKKILKELRLAIKVFSTKPVKHKKHKIGVLK